MISLIAMLSLISTLSALAGHTPSPASPEQQRLALMARFQQQFSSKDVKSWRERAVNSALDGPMVQAIPFDSENATNSADVLAIGRKLWESKLKNGKTLGSCFPANGKRAAIGYPLFDPKINRIVTLEQAINDCMEKNGERGFPFESQQMASISIYLRTLAIGQRLDIKVSTSQAIDAFSRGKATFSRRMGQKNLACASCHVITAGEKFNQQSTIQESIKKYQAPLIGLTIGRPALERGGKIRTLQLQIQQCMTRVGAEPFEIGTEDMNQIEYFVSFMSNNLALEPLAEINQ